MIEIKMKVDEVDYERALETLLPLLAEHFSSKTGDIASSAGRAFLLKDGQRVDFRNLIQDERTACSGGKGDAEDVSPGDKR